MRCACAGVRERVMAQAVMMRGRMVHALDGAAELQRYGRDDEVIWSVHRGELNRSCSTPPKRAARRLHFDAAPAWRRFRRTAALEFVDETTARTARAAFAALLGADGAGSARARGDGRRAELGERFEPLGHGYKELEIPPAPTAASRSSRTRCTSGRAAATCASRCRTPTRTFTVTLFLPQQGDPTLRDAAGRRAARARCSSAIPRRAAADPGPRARFFEQPAGLLGTLYLERWHLDDARCCSATPRTRWCRSTARA